MDAVSPMDPWSDFLRRMLVTVSLRGASSVPPPKAGAAAIETDPAEPAASENLSDIPAPRG